MTRSRLLTSLALAFVLCSSCSSNDKEQAQKAVQDLGSKTKEAAEDAAEKTKEVAADAAHDIANKGKEVVSATGEAITDGWITTKLKAKFADDKELKDRITVETSDRVVTLKGTVVADAAKKRAVMIASGTEGVLRVVDKVVVKAQ